MGTRQFSGKGVGIGKTCALPFDVCPHPHLALIILCRHWGWLRIWHRLGIWRYVPCMHCLQVYTRPVTFLEPDTAPSTFALLPWSPVPVVHVMKCAWSRLCWSSCQVPMLSHKAVRCALAKWVCLLCRCANRPAWYGDRRWLWSWDWTRLWFWVCSWSSIHQRGT